MKHLLQKIRTFINGFLKGELEIKFVKLHHNAVSPKYAKDGDAGMDLTATSYEYDPYQKMHIYGTGVAVEIPEGYVGYVFPRSSNFKKNVLLSNSVGVIDSGYRGEIKAFFREVPSPMDDKYLIGDRICQLVIMPYPKINFVQSKTLTETKRGKSGFGSSGR